MKVKSNGTTYTLATNGVQTSTAQDGANSLIITIPATGLTLDGVKTAFTKAEKVEILDDAGTVSQTYEDYITLASVEYVGADDTIKVTIKTLSLAESAKLLKAENTELQLAVATLAGGEN